MILLILSALSPAHVSAGLTGGPAPALQLWDMNGAVVTLEQFKGKVVLLDFWAPWCISCRDGMADLDRLYRKFQREGFIVVAIAVDASAEGVSIFLKKVPVSFPVAIDPQSSVADAYSISNLPSGYLIDRGGVIRRFYRGFDKDIVHIYEKDILELLEQHNP